jgi:hypothetical protein
MTYADKFDEVATMHYGAEEPICKQNDADVDRTLRFNMMLLAGWEFDQKTKIKHLEGIDIYLDTKEPF